MPTPPRRVESRGGPGTSGTTNKRRRVEFTSTPPDSNNFTLQLKHLQNGAFAKGTWKNYETKFRKFKDFCPPGCINKRTADLWISRFAGHLALNEKLQFRTIQGYVATIRKLLSVYQNLKLDFMPKTELVLRGIKNHNNPTPKRATPITLSMLESISENIDRTCKTETNLWCMVLWGFFLALRKSNLTPSNSMGTGT